jgi:hypothetical protein
LGGARPRRSRAPPWCASPTSTARCRMTIATGSSRRSRAPRPPAATLRVDGPTTLRLHAHRRRGARAHGARHLLDASVRLPPIHFVTGAPDHARRARWPIDSDIAGTRCDITPAPPRDYDVSRFVGDPSRAEELLGWRAAVPLRDGLARLIAVFAPLERAFDEDPPGHPRLPDALQRRVRGLHPDPVPRPRRAGHEVHVFTREEDSFARGLRDAARRRRRRQRGSRSTSSTTRAAGTATDTPASTSDSPRCSTGRARCRAHRAPQPPVDLPRREAATRGIPVVYTLHDYWVMCPRGQFMQMHPADPGDLWAVCDGQEDRKCAEHCYARYFSGARPPSAPGRRVLDRLGRSPDAAHSRGRRAGRPVHVAPARYLLDRYRDEFGLPERKLVYLDYGFDHSRLAGRSRPRASRSRSATSAPTSREGHPPADRAFGQAARRARLRIWGRPRGQETDRAARARRALPGTQPSRIEWLPEYRNQEIVPDVFDRVDAIVVPVDLGRELAAGHPRGAAGAGPGDHRRRRGHGRVRPPRGERPALPHRERRRDLAAQMQRLVDDPALARTPRRARLSTTPTATCPTSKSTSWRSRRSTEQLIARRDSARASSPAGPWRITFDTNPDTCNLHCIMCEEHSPAVPLQIGAQGGGPAATRDADRAARAGVAEAAPNGLREVIPSTMGEPLLYEHFERIIDALRRARGQAQPHDQRHLPAPRCARLGRAIVP